MTNKWLIVITILINNEYWCSPPEDTNACQIDCNQLLDDDITDDVKCVKTIYSIHGFSAWTGWKKKCYQQDITRYLRYCDLSPPEKSWWRKDTTTTTTATTKKYSIISRKYDIDESTIRKPFLKSTLKSPFRLIINTPHYKTTKKPTTKTYKLYTTTSTSKPTKPYYIYIQKSTAKSLKTATSSPLSISSLKSKGSSPLQLAEQLLSNIAESKPSMEVISVPLYRDYALKTLNKITLMLQDMIKKFNYAKENNIL